MKTATLNDATISQLSEEGKIVFLKMMKRMNFFMMKWNISFVIYTLLDYLKNHRNHVEAAEAADDLSIPRQTMTALLDNLEKRGVLTRQPHPQDRRRKIICLTPRGVEKIRVLNRELHTMEISAMTEMGVDDMRRLIKLLQKQTDAWERASQAYDGPITPF